MKAGIPLDPAEREAWRREITRPPAREEQTEPDRQLVFRVGGEWFSIAAAHVLEITGETAIHSIPHRGSGVSGVVNIRGKVTPCVSLHVLLSPLPGDSVAARTVVFEENGWWCATRVDDVDGVHPVLSSALRPIPAPHDRAASELIDCLWDCGERTVARLNSAALFQTFRRTLS